MLIGVAGFPCAGKGVVTDILREKGFTTISLSDILREATDVLGMERTRQNLVDLAVFVREKASGETLAKEAIRRVGTSNAVLESVRHPDEVKALKDSRGMFLFVVADAKKRFERMSERAREKDPSTWEAFLLHELIEHGVSDGAGQRIADCRNLADHVIENNGSLEELKERVEELLSKIDGQEKPAQLHDVPSENHSSGTETVSEDIDRVLYDRN